MRYHCEFCDREGHLEEFCFRRKRAVRREQERWNTDMYSARVHGPSRRGDRRDARARRVGGGQGTVGVTVLQQVVALPAVLLVVFSTAMDHGPRLWRRF